jgi:hypothetical protein
LFPESDSVRNIRWAQLRITFSLRKKEWPEKARNFLKTVWLLSFEPRPDPNIIRATKSRPGSRAEAWARADLYPLVLESAVTSPVWKQNAVLPSGLLWHSNWFYMVEELFDPSEEMERETLFIDLVAGANIFSHGIPCTSLPSGGRIWNFVLLRTKGRQSWNILGEYFWSQMLTILLHVLLKQWPLERPRRRLEDNIKMDLKGIEYEGVDWYAASIIGAMSHRRDDGGSKDLWNVGKLLPDYTVLQPRTQPSSYSPPREPQIQLILWRAIVNTAITFRVPKKWWVIFLSDEGLSASQEGLCSISLLEARMPLSFILSSVFYFPKFWWSWTLYIWGKWGWRAKLGT